MLKKILLLPFSTLFALLGNPFGWIVLGSGGYMLYTFPSPGMYLGVFVVWTFVGYGLMPKFTPEHEEA